MNSGVIESVAVEGAPDKDLYKELPEGVCDIRTGLYYGATKKEQESEEMPNIRTKRKAKEERR